METITTSGTGLPVLFLVAGITVLWAVIRAYSKPSFSNAVKAGTFWDKIRFIYDGERFLQEAYEKHDQRTFRFTTLRGRRQVVVCTDALINELKLLSDEYCSFPEWAQDSLLLDYTLPRYRGERANAWPAIASQVSLRFFRGPMTKDLGNGVPFMHSDIVECIDEKLNSTGPSTEKSVILACELTGSSTTKAVCRLLVGDRLCEDRELRDAMADFAATLPKAVLVLSLFPDVLKPFASKHFTGLEKAKDRAFSKLRAYAEDPTSVADAQHTGERATHSFFQQLLDATEKRGRWGIDRVIDELMMTMFAAFHTTSSTAAVVLLMLAEHAEYQQPLREEIEGLLAKEGSWSRDVLDKMWKMDSFIKESRRLHSLGPIGLNRTVMKEFQLSDGTILTPGTYVSAMVGPRHMDSAAYENPATFDGFRFSKSRMENSANASVTEINNTFYLFGGGLHPCPGRYFAIAMIKIILGHILLHYRVSRSEDTLSCVTFEENHIPNPSARIELRKL